MVDKKRRIRIKRNPANTVTPAKKKAEMEAKAKDNEALMAQIMELQEQVRQNEAELLQFMDSYKLQVVEATYGNYEYTVPKGKSSTDIDVNELKARMTDEDFLTVVKPSVTEVKKHFSPKELADFSTVTPGKEGAPVVKYKPHKNK